MVKGNNWIPGFLMCSILLSMSTQVATSDIELPAWEPNSDPVALSGATLWPSEDLPEGEQKAEPQLSQASDYVILPRESVESILARIKLNPGDDNLPVIEKELKAEFFAQKPPHYLIDPQKLLTEQKSNDILRFLEIQARESPFKIYPMVLGRLQKIPSDIDLNKLHEDWFGDSLALLVVYKVRDPDSLQIIYHQRITEKIPPSEIADIRANCIAEAKTTSRGPGQLEKIVIELGIHSFWLEKLLNSDEITPETILTLQKEVTLPPAIAEIAYAPEPLAEAKKPIQPLKPESPTLVASDMIKVIVIGSFSVIFLALIFFVRGFLANRRAFEQAPILFPSYHRRERLGGEFTGGTFVGISFELGQSDGRIG